VLDGDEAPETSGLADSQTPVSHAPAAVEAKERTVQPASSESSRADARRVPRQAVWVVAASSLFLVAVHTYVALSRDRPLIFADEAGYLGNARFLAGGLPIKMFKAGAYYPGYSLLLIPVYWLGLSPEHTYQVALVLNGLLLGTAYFSLIGWTRWLLGENSKYSYWIAFTASLYPTFLVQPGFAMSESAAIAVATALPLLCYRFIASRRVIYGVAFALMTVLLHAIHPRFAGTVGAAVLVTAVAAVFRAISVRSALLTGLVLGAGVFGTRALTAYISSVNGGGTSKSAERMANTMTRLDGIWAIVLEAFGQFWYLGVATAGLVVVGLVALVKLLLAPVGSGPRWASPRWLALAFTLLAAAVAFGVSSAFLSNPRRVDHFIYGRYNECVLAPVLATGIWALVRAGKSWRAHAWNFGIVAACLLPLALVLVWARGDDWFGHKNLANIIAIIPLIRLVSGMHLVALSLVAIGAYLLFSLGTRWRPWLGLGLVCAGFLAAAHNSFDTFMDMQKGRAKRQVLFDRAATLPDLDKLSYDAAYLDPVTLFFGQYFLPKTEFVFFDSARGEEPPTNYVLGSQKWPRAKALAPQLVAKDRAGFSLWSAKSCCKPLSAFSSNGAFGLTDGVTVSGFYPVENWAIGSVRWTDGDAVITAPLGKDTFATASLYLDIASAGPLGSRLEVTANGKDLFDGKVIKGRSRMFLPLSTVPDADALIIHVRSSTFVPADGGDSTDKRQLGVALRSIQVVPDCCLSNRDPFVPAP
jgi:hypothetical protein